MKNYFSENVVEWYNLNSRKFPWRKTKDPYHIWISEIILQQTRINQGLPYYREIIKTYPNIHVLAASSENKLLKKWQGLGYYSRAKNMLHTAKYISSERKGIFPDNYNDLLKLKGVGPYTAAAIASISFNEPKAVLDGNVYRVIARYFGVDDMIDTIKGRNRFNKLANDLINYDDPGNYNQAIMDFGSVICMSQKPKCKQCVLKIHCIAKKDDKIMLLPIKKKKITVKERYFNYIIIKSDEYWFLQKRNNKDIWNGLYEFPLIETKSKADITITKQWNQLFKYEIPSVSGLPKEYSQQLTHQKIFGYFWEIKTKSDTPFSNTIEIIRIKKSSINKFPFPKIVDCYLKNK